MVESVQCLSRAGHDITVVFPEGGEASEIWDDLGVRKLEISSSWWVSIGRPTIRDKVGGLRRNVLGARALTEVIRHERFNLVATNTITVPVAAFAAHFAGVPHVWFIQEYFGDLTQLRFRFGQRLSLAAVDRLSKAIVFNSSALRDHYARYLPPPKLHVIEIPVVAPDPATSVPERTGLRLVMSGQITPLKGHEDAVRALAHLKTKGTRAHLEIDGPTGGEYQRELENLAKGLGVTEQVHFVGLSNDPMAWLEAADIVLMCSRIEAFGRVTVEAMKLGTPVIGAAVGGTAGLIDDGVTGFLYKPGDAVGLAAKIEALADDPSRLARVGAAAMETARERFNLERHTRELEKLFERVASGL